MHNINFSKYEQDINMLYFVNKVHTTYMNIHVVQRNKV